MSDLRVLFVQNQLCVRAWNEAASLTQRGVKVSLVELARPSSPKDYSIFERHVNLPVPPDLRSMVLHARKVRRGLRGVLRGNGFDVVHTHNEPDFFGAILPQLSGVPVVHDIHDIVTEAPITYSGYLRNRFIAGLYAAWEAKACRRASAVLTVSPRMADYYRRKYGLSRVVAVENRPIPRGISRRRKLSAGDGVPHLVYAGSLSASFADRQFLDDMVAMAGRGLSIHIYPAWVDARGRAAIRQVCDRSPNLHYHEPVPPERAMEEISQYDYGIIWSSQPREINAQVSCPNKLHEYLLAGLQIVTNLRGGYVGDYVASHGYGLVVASARELPSSLPVPEPLDLRPEEHFLDPGDILAVYEEIRAEGSHK